MKKHSLAEHLRDVEDWWLRTRSLKLEDRLTVVFIAYERWLNDRVLLSEEDETEPTA